MDITHRLDLYVLDTKLDVAQGMLAQAVATSTAVIGGTSLYMM